MRHLKLLAICLAMGGLITAQNKVECNPWLLSEVETLYSPAFSEQKSVDNAPFLDKDLLDLSQINLKLAEKNAIVKSLSDSIVSGVQQKYQLLVLTGYVETDQYAKPAMMVSSNGIYEVYLDGKKVSTQSRVSTRDNRIPLTLETGKHQVQIKLMSVADSLSFAAHVACKSDTIQLNWSTDATRNLTINDVVNGRTISSVDVSPSGKYALISEVDVMEGSGDKNSSTRIYDVTNQKNIFVIRNGSRLAASWLPKTDRFVYSVKKGNAYDVYVYDMTTKQESLLIADVEDLGRMNWSPNEDFVIYSSMKRAKTPGDLKRVYTNDDRMPNYRNRNYLYYLEVKTGLVRPLSTGYMSASLHDISPDGSRILFSTSRADLSEVPFRKQNLYEMDLKTMELDTIWQDKLYGGNCEYSPDGSKLLVLGAPETFGDLGVNVDSGLIVNTYDSQLFLFDLKTKEAKALTKDFDPSIGSVTWSPKGTVYFTATNGDRTSLYSMNPEKGEITPLDLSVDVIQRISFADFAPVALYTGTSITTDQQLYSIQLKSGKSSLLEMPKKEVYEHITLGKTEDWDFTNKNGANIEGRVYYPANFDAGKKYPVIVYYYGGTTPTTRSFGGRYPKNVWAANGYVVYVLQPSGAIGYGQNFSALHVNGWGLDAIDDIIDGTKAFLAAHDFADAENVGCIGASYGGYTTMMLQTRTDIFKTAISHAGISDITSYWGEGYWGYSYSSTASRGSYPWNNRELYVDNSPLFNADKFQNSILLLHGTKDTNVPTGESWQYYAALKLLQKDVEMVLIDGEDHHILDYKKRLDWHDTIVSWFDFKLKNQPQHWNEMYPEKNL